MAALLFEPLKIQEMTLANRVVVAPMCQYSAVDGIPQPWHLQHYGSLAASGPGMIVLEATGVTPRGRITPHCLGLYSDACEKGLAHLVTTIKEFGETKIAIQLGHAGRKASSMRPWEGEGTVSPKDGGWLPAAPSAIAYSDAYMRPEEIGPYEIDILRRAFAKAAERANRAGVDTVELHSAHGYLLHQFLSPLSNRRGDIYGGSLENRMRFPLEVIRTVRRVWPANKPFGIRLSVTDWAEGGFDLDEAVIFAQRCKGEGVDYMCVSSGGLVPYAKITTGPGYQVGFAERIRKESGLITRAVGLINDPRQAEDILARGQADMVALARGFLDDPRWVWHAAEVLGEEVPRPPQYMRVRPAVWPGAANRGR